MNYKECPYCGTYDTEKVHIERFSDIIEETRICSDCPTQFTNQFSLIGQLQDVEVYQCEQCGKLVNEHDATLKNEAGVDETITLAFCKECANE